MTKIKVCCSNLYSKDNAINAYLVPGHKEIRGKKQADMNEGKGGSSRSE